MIDSEHFSNLIDVLYKQINKTQNKITPRIQQAKIKAFSPLLQIEKFILVIFEYFII